MRFRVLHNQWAAENDVFAGGEHDVEKPSASILRLAAGAEAAGSIEILDASDQERSKLDRHVQSQEKAEAAYAKAQADGSWQYGNLCQFALDREDALAYDKTLEDDHPDKLSPEIAGLLAHQLDQAKAELADMEVPS